MVREFKLPDVGEGLTEAEIVNWLVQPGDTVEEDQPVAEVETDKAVVEVPSPVNGTVKDLRAEEGEMVPVGEVIITFTVEGETGDDGSQAVDGVDHAGGNGSEPAIEPADEAAAEEGDVAPGPDGDGAGTGEERVFAAPSARRLARELGVDISAVDGSGPGGRVTEQDVRAAEGASTGGDAETEAVVEESAGDADTAPTTADEAGPDGTGPQVGAEAEPEAADRDRTLAAPATRQLATDLGVDLDSVPATEERDGEAFVTQDAVKAYADAQEAAQAADADRVEATTGEDREAVERIPYRGVRRTIGQAMERSKFTAPHVTHHDDADVSELVAVRSDLKAEAGDRGIRLTYMPFVIKAAIAALKQHPILNSQLDEEEEEIVLKSDYNIGVATATEAGLMVPVVRDADRKGLLQIASEMNELVDRAQERSISREEMQGGTFTVTNFGAIGGEYATPIINYPETAILGLGAIKERPRVVDGEVVPRETVTLSLSIDHRIIDGADAAAFVNTLKGYLEQPHRLLLE